MFSDWLVIKVVNIISEKAYADVYIKFINFLNYDIIYLKFIEVKTMRLEDYIVTEDTTIIETMKQLDKNASGNIFLCQNGILLAAVTDGDVRRSIMKEVDRNEPICKIGNYNPLFLNIKDRRQADELMRREGVTALPLVDDNLKIIDIKFLLKNPLLTEAKINIPVVIMAGGKGTRLKPYTDILPKPLIPIGDKTITEHIMEHFEKYGCNRFHIIVNYKKNFIKSYFADSENKINLNFIEEQEYLGTGGGLALLQDTLNETFFLTNCDVLIDTAYDKILQEHRDKRSIITIVCAKKKITVPYGTVDIDKEGKVIKFQEKPSFDCNTSTGLYVIEPEFLCKIKKDMVLPITDIIQQCLDEGERVGTYLIDEENWMDMGQLEELEKMKEKMGI